MDFTFLEGFIIPIVLVACLVAGYILKAWIKDLDNKYIPTILALFGAILACMVNKSIGVDNLVYGALTGLTSTGLHQLFKQYIDNGKKG